MHTLMELNSVGNVEIPISIIKKDKKKKVKLEKDKFKIN